MRRAVIIATATASLILTAIGPAFAETATAGGTTASTVGAWVKPTGCSQFLVTYSGLPDTVLLQKIMVLDAATRATLGMSLVTGQQPRAGQTPIQICSQNVTTTTSMVLAVDGLAGYAESAPFGWASVPSAVRCVNKRTYSIKEFTGKACPKGWVRR
ncbi:MAG: hypothetical protein NTX29_12235 [Actinobacteria bacterium]|nr:hypothetical protein [Actinomycetota bacterium]